MNLKFGSLGLRNLALGILLSCGRNSDPIQINALKNFVWPQNQKLDFEFEPPTNGNALDLLYQVQIDPSYSYQNIWLTYWLIDPAGDTLTISKDNLFLFEQSGKPIGEQIKERQFVDAYFLRNIKLSKPGKYHLHPACGFG